VTEEDDYRCVRSHTVPEADGGAVGVGENCVAEEVHRTDWGRGSADFWFDVARGDVIGTIGIGRGRGAAEAPRKIETTHCRAWYVEKAGAYGSGGHARQSSSDIGSHRFNL